MITIPTILTILAIILILAILFKLYKLVAAALHIPEPWAQIAYWILVLIIVVWALGFLGIMQPIIK